MAEALRVGIAGLGTVGASVARVLRDKATELTRQCGRDIIVSAVSARDRKRDRGIDLSAANWFDDPVKMAQTAELDVFVELIGGDEGPARASVKAALEAGRHVVTANKALLAKHGVALAEIAEKKGVLLNYEAAVAGGIPVIKTMREAMAGNSVNRVFGILNGTCNYILTRMEAEGVSFDVVLKDAQRLGYAEADPTFDIEGHDTAHKLSILTSLAFGTRIAANDIYMEGISNITQADIRAAGDLGYRIKLLGVAQRTESGIEQRVHPTMVPTASVIAQVHGVTNAVAIETDILGELLLSGPGAGGNATASAVIGDVADIAKSRPGFQHGPVFGRPAKELKPYRKAQMRSHAGGYFIRLTVHDRIGVFAAIAKRMADNDISLESIVQHAVSGEAAAQKTVILVTHETTEAAVRKAVDGITKDGHLTDKPQVIRIERAG
ncbi:MULTISPECIES: homoserine dehydrogenase [unclassified Mesorhizobium]|uniref:homoserine dehydrogenase n=1 Tax=unclassified Mesorhizobium TaxID=325217 RepID=UPI000FCBF224|nr:MULTISPECIES: homoserine dehydrogenase [unclassified Mesorhizobium]TGR38915.1 homoserine dehydrogenase [bacterium M00.F.Ca.ET.199.01.1.1]TGU27527.1 homoserine dehydrogenase [bacterium M00.F.Ca.ET.156.01.1.1]TGU89726.1 homoserine dehydrogenase [Mesorhizobium sp. M00.F.Ca.ET.151.01.1.1]TGV16519.1 homoserine dehydrogenase [Mesorhizobium sp. M8A.F.Ca.ET.173.01.1.1]TGV83951.1 homoserine dehydrogenase [Mesorhizobium sp. M00.F.Ca.ET.149.01.1.1]